VEPSVPLNGHHDLRKRAPAIGTVLALLLIVPTGQASRKHAAPAAPGRDAEERATSRHGVDMLMDGDTDGAIKVFRQIQENDPQSPLGYLLEAQSIWWKIYYTTADLLDPDVFDVAKLDYSPLDSHFSDLLSAAITRSEAHLKAQEDVARNNLYEGMAYALQARLTGMRGKDLATARAGKKMRSYLMQALKLNSHLEDAELGLGNYNYFIDTLPPAIKLLRILGNVPGGDKDLGLRQIRQASETGDLTRGEARFYLAKNYSTDGEKQYQKSLELFQGLARDYPHNPLWKLLSGDMRCRLGETREGDALFRQVGEETRGMVTETEHAVHVAAHDGYLRRHPGDKTME
jgi:Tetratricopeptide repeat